MEIGEISGDRLTPTNKFSATSVDYTDHYVVQPYSSSQATFIVWSLLDLCDLTKVLHTELVENCSGPGIVQSLKILFSVLNTPSQITTNIGRNFVKAKRLMF